MGLVELLPNDYNKLLAAILILQRIIQGFAAFIVCKITVECCRAWFPDHFDFTVALEVSAYYLGGSLAILMGGYVYDAYGYQVPFICCGSIALAFWTFNLIFMPRTSEAVLTIEPKDEGTGGTIAAPWSDENVQSEDRTEGEASNKSEVIPTYGLSWLVFIPLVAMSLTQVLEGFSGAITTPYLNEIYDMPLSRGSSIVCVQYLGLMAGAAISGSVMQIKLPGFTAPKVMAAGSFLALVGVMLVFPGEGIEFLHNLVPKLAYLGVFLQGFGCQMIGVASLSAVEEIHKVLGQRTYTSNNMSTAATLWLCAWTVAAYSGNLVALMVMKYMSYNHGAWMLVVFSAISMVLSICQDVAVRRSEAVSQRDHSQIVPRPSSYTHRLRLSDVSQ